MHLSLQVKCTVLCVDFSASAVRHQNLNSFQSSTATIVASDYTNENVVVINRDVKRASINRCLDLKAMIDFASR